MLSLSLQGSAARGNHPCSMTSSSPRGNAATSIACRPMPASLLRTSIDRIFMQTPMDERRGTDPFHIIKKRDTPRFPLDALLRHHRLIKVLLKFPIGLAIDPAA